jgi:hypothetical protein
MRSSRRSGAVRSALAALFSTSMFLAAACSGPPAPAEQQTGTERPASAASPACDPAPSSPAPDPAVLKELRAAAEKSPLFLAAASGRPFTSCQAASQGSALTLEYRFENGATFVAASDSQIEYSNQEATFPAPPGEDAAAILQRAEREAFGPDGCGIDWKASTTETSTNARSTAQVFRGTACSCQARIRRDAGGRVIGLQLRSSC